MYLLDEHPEIVDAILNYLNRKPKKKSEQIFRNFEGKFEGKDPSIHPIISALHGLHFIEPKNDLYEVASKGYDVLKAGGFVNYETKEKERLSKEERYFDTQIRIAEKTIKYFNRSVYIGIFGGILGAATFVFNIISPPKEVIFQPIQKEMPQINNQDSTQLISPMDTVLQDTSKIELVK